MNRTAKSTEPRIAQVEDVESTAQMLEKDTSRNNTKAIVGISKAEAVCPLLGGTTTRLVFTSLIFRNMLSSLLFPTTARGKTPAFPAAMMNGRMLREPMSCVTAFPSSMLKRSLRLLPSLVLLPLICLLLTISEGFVGQASIRGFPALWQLRPFVRDLPQSLCRTHYVQEETRGPILDCDARSLGPSIAWPLGYS